MSTSSEYLDILGRLTEVKANALAGGARGRGQIIGTTLQSLGQIVPQIQQARQQQQDRQALDQERQSQGAYRDAQTAALQKQLNAPPDPLHAINLALTQHEALSRILSNTTADNYSARRQVALQIVPQAAGDLPEAFPGDDYIKSLHDAGIPVKDQLEEARKQAEDAAKNQPKTPSLVPIPGPDGKPIYGTPTAGAPVYEKPPVASTANPTEASLALAAARGGPEGVAAKQALALMRGQRVGAGDASTVKPVLDAQGQPVTGDDLLKTLPSGQAVLVKKLAEGKMAFPSGTALRSEYWQKLLEQVGQYDPNFDAINYNARASTRKDFTSGKSADSIRAMNTVVGHIAQLSDAADALKNKNTQGYNQIANALATEFGWTGKTDFDTIAPKVAQELTRVWRGTGGSESDIQRDLDNLSSSNAPAQLHSSIGNLGKLIESQLASMQEKYRQGMGINDIQMISPEARKNLDKLETRAGGKPAAGSSSPTVGSIVTFQGKRYTVTGITNGQADLEPVQ